MRLLLLMVLELARGQRFGPSSPPWRQPADPSPTPWHQPPSSPSPAPYRPPWSPTNHQHAPAAPHQGLHQGLYQGHQGLHQNPHQGHHQSQHQGLHQGADVVLSSSGGARRWKGSTLGRYRALPGGAGAYRKEATRTRPALFLYKLGTWWYVNRQLGRRGGLLRAQDLGGSPGGWEFWRRGWRADPTLVARCFLQP